MQICRQAEIKIRKCVEFVFQKYSYTYTVLCSREEISFIDGISRNPILATEIGMRFTFLVKNSSFLVAHLYLLRMYPQIHATYPVLTTHVRVLNFELLSVGSLRTYSRGIGLLVYVQLQLFIFYSLRFNLRESRIKHHRRSDARLKLHTQFILTFLLGMKNLYGKYSVLEKKKKKKRYKARRNRFISNSKFFSLWQ